MRTHTLGELKNLEDNTEVKVCGWIHDVRNIGRIAFIVLRDRYGFAQVTAIKKELGKEKFKELVSLPRESVICVKGILKKSEIAKMGFEIIPKDYEVLSISSKPLPLGVADKVSADLDTRLDNRFLDLRKPEVFSIFKIRSDLLEGIRNSLLKRDFVEVHTPKIVASATEGGTQLFEVKYFENKAYLVQSPQLYKQIMMGAGFDRVFEIAPAFRAEEHDTTRHLNEFISVDVEFSFADHNDAMKLLENVIYESLKHVEKKSEEHLDKLGVEIKIQKPPFPRVTYDEVLEIARKRGIDIPWGEDIPAEGLNAVGEEYKDTYYFIVDWPISTKPFYAMPEDDKISRAFDLQYGPREVSSGAQRIHDYDLLVKRLKECGLNPDDFDFYLQAFRYGMPPHAGWAIGMERYLMVLLDLKNIREAILFPRDRKRLHP